MEVGEVGKEEARFEEEMTPACLNQEEGCWLVYCKTDLEGESKAEQHWWMQEEENLVVRWL